VAPQADRKPAPALRMLLADDDEELLELASSYLKRDGWEVATVRVARHIEVALA
jgi:hypothetical protein